MNKKQLRALLDGIVGDVVAKANAAPGDEPALSEGEARTLVGIRLRRLAPSIVESILGGGE
jgi:hypothetical protein